MSQENISHGLPGIPFEARRLTLFLTACSVFALIAWVWPAPEGLSSQGQRAIALMAAAVIVWVFEVFPLAVAAMLMTVVQPLAGVTTFQTALGNFANPIVFFVFGMFCFTLAFTRTGFSERVALWISLIAQGSPARLLLCFIAGGTVISMFMADVPVVVMLAPVALKVIEKNNCVPMQSNFAKALMIGLPLGVLIGGVATPTGASMNVLTMQFLRDMAGVDISYLQWCAIGVPVALVLIPVTWLLLLWIFPSELTALSGAESMREEYAKLGPMTRQESRFVLFVLVNVVLWCTDSLHGISLPILAVLGGAALFFPGIDLIDWKYAFPRMGWDIMMLIGGACSLSMALWKTGAAAWIGTTFLGGLLHLPLFVLMLGIALFAVWIHLLVPNSTAIVAVFTPTIIALAKSKGVSPAILTLPLGFMASASLVLVIDAVQLVTYQYGYYSMKDWIKNGAILSVFWIFVTIFSVMFIGSLLGFY